MNKVERDGKIAVLYSPGFGAGWSTWNSEHREALCMDARLVDLVLAGKKEEVARVAKELFPGIYTGGAHDLTVTWLDKGAAFEIDEYDGSESVYVIGDHNYMVA